MKSIANVISGSEAIVYDISDNRAAEAARSDDRDVYDVSKRSK